MNPYFLKPIIHAQAISLFTLLFFLFVMAGCPVSGQNGQTKLVQPKDYDMWHKLSSPQISGDGKWISYQLVYQQKQDTLVVIDAKGNIKREMPDAHSGQFEPSKNPTLFAFRDNKKGVGLLYLDTGKTEWLKEADRFEFTKNGKYLVCYSPKEQNGYLKLINIQKNQTSIIHGIQYFNFDPTGNTAFIITNDSINSKMELLRLNNMQKAVVLSSERSDFLYPLWNEKGDAFAFMESTQNSKQRLYYFKDGETPILKELDDITLRKIGNVGISKINFSFSQDGERIFFWTHQIKKNLKVEEKDTVSVQLWKGSDKWIYPRQKLDWEYNKNDLMAVWQPKTQNVFQIGNTKRPEVILTGDQKHAVSYNILTYEPQYKQFPQSDFYITNLETGGHNLLAEKLETASGFLTMAPSGDFVAYFKGNNWWIYNIRNNQHINATLEIPFPLNFKHPPFSIDPIPFGFAGWNKNDELLVYDEFDIWRISATGKKAVRITDGRDSKICYRPYNNLYDDFLNTLVPIHSTNEYDLSNDSILVTYDNQFNRGYAVRKGNGGIEPFIIEKGKICGLRKAKYSDSYIFLKETNIEPPALYLRKHNKETILVQSNPQQDKFAIGKTELIFYKNKEGEKLHGLLHYPDNYQKEKQYPMIVHIYELMSNRYQNYINPSLYNSDGFNVRNTTASGYFVLEPDIIIQPGNPGISATDCVINAVNEVLKKELVNKNAIGLIGHSFGGYETAFIISQSNIFKAAVVGAGIFDIVSSYHTIGKESGRPEQWRFESYQLRFGKSFYEDKEAYSKNSPLNYADRIKTPTLVWTGNKDYQVNWHQSEEMYLALRRLNIDVELLIYENELHTLSQPKNKKDLTTRIINWFDNYLKIK